MTENGKTELVNWSIWVLCVIVWFCMGFVLGHADG